MSESAQLVMMQLNEQSREELPTAIRAKLALGSSAEEFFGLQNTSVVKYGMLARPMPNACARIRGS